MHADLIEHREKLGKQVVDVAFQLHSKLGQGLLKSVYETCFCYELNKRNISFVSQKRCRSFMIQLYLRRVLSLIFLSVI